MYIDVFYSLKKIDIFYINLLFLKDKLEALIRIMFEKIIRNAPGRISKTSRKLTIN